MTAISQTEKARGHIAYDASAALALAGQAKQALDCADIQIDSDMLLEIAAEDLKSVKALQHEVEAQRTAITRPLNQAVRAINELFRAPKEYLESAERQLKRAILQYTGAREQEAQQARLAAEEMARVERERLADYGHEQERLAQDAQAQSDWIQQQAERAAEDGDLDVATKAKAQAAHLAIRADRARLEAAAAAQTAEVITIAPEVAPPARLSGISGRVAYTAQVIDLAVLVRAVAEGAAPLECLQANEKFLGAQARALRRTGMICPGVQALAERQLAATRAEH
jgi:hypothetical protein